MRGKPRKSTDDDTLAFYVSELCVDALLVAKGSPPRPGSENLKSKAPPDAHRLASALACMSQLIEKEWAHTKLDEARATGLIDAFDLVAALRDGSSHPVYAYAKGVRQQQKPNVPSIQQLWRRALATALYRELGENRSAAEEVRRTFAQAGVEIARMTLVEWNNRFREDDDELPRLMALEMTKTASEHGISVSEAAFRRFIYRDATYPQIE